MGQSVIIVQQPSDAKVEHFHAQTINQHIRRLQITVDDAGLMRIANGIAECQCSGQLVLR
ncbi:MAG: hypothetical protein AAGI08_06955 [Bacteroidota bacterium]